MGALATIGRWLGVSRAASDPAANDALFFGSYFASQTNAGISISQTTALSSSAVLACVSILSSDVAKIRPVLYKRGSKGAKKAMPGHWLAVLLRRPNDWQTRFEFTEMLMVQLLLRSNAYAVIIRNGAGKPVKLVPINSDRVAIWEAPEGEIFYRVTPSGLHERAQLHGQPFLIPAEDVLHLKGLSLNGLLGSATMVLGKEAIALSLAYEQQASLWMANASKPSGILSTEQKLTHDAAKRMSQDWKDINSGLQNAGKVAVLEQGLKYQKMAFDAVEMDFIKSRQYQLEDLGRLWRVPLHMISAQSGKVSSGSVEQQASEYLNLTLSTWTCRIGEKIDAVFGVTESGLELEWDYSLLTRADRSTRIAMYARAIAGGMLTPNEARFDDGLDPKEGGDELWKPSNVAFAGSQTGGVLPDGGGRPEGSPNKEPVDQ